MAALTVLLALAVAATILVAPPMVFQGTKEYLGRTSPQVYKVAVKEDEIDSDSFIICRLGLTTGYDWLLLQDENGDRSPEEPCLISGPDPFLDHGLKMEFYNNRFVFYVTDKRVFFNEELGEMSTEYTVGGWDVLYPVKRDFPYPSLPEYMLRSDTYSLGR